MPVPVELDALVVDPVVVELVELLELDVVVGLHGPH